MPNLFLALDADWFAGEIRPALTASRHQQAFAPLKSLCARLLPRVEAFGVAEVGQLLAAIQEGAAYDRHLWRGLVADILLLAATEIPEIRLPPRTLCLLLGEVGAGQGPREKFSPIEQALFGSRELSFGSHPYRPLEVGVNETADVARLADYLAGIDRAGWLVDDRVVLAELDAEDRDEELAFLREGAQSLSHFYARSVRANQLIICEADAS